MAANYSNDRSMISGSGGSQFSLRSIIVTLYRHKWVVLAVACPIILVGGFALLNQSGSFWATARILVEFSNVDQPRWNATGRNVDYDRELSTMYNIAMSVSVGKLAAKSLEDSIPVIRSLDPMFSNLEGVRGLEGFLMTNTNVTVVGESRILEFQTNAIHPRLALMGVGAMRDAFIDFLISGQQNSRAVAYYEEQISQMQAELDSLQMQRAAILEDAGYSEIKDQLRYEASGLVEVSYELMEARSLSRATEIKYDVLFAALEGDPREFPMGKDESRSYSLVELRKLVIEQENVLNRLKAIHTPNSIPVLQQQELFDGALSSLRREQRAFVESVGITVEGLRQKERLLEDLVAVYEGRQQSAPKAAYLLSRIDTETNSMREVLEALQIKLGEVRIAHQADDRVSSIIPLTQPTLSEVISSGKSMLYFLMLCFFAVALGVTAAFVLDILDHRISSSEEITEHLQLPVFASILKAK